MRLKTSSWFETKIRYEKTDENGMQKKITEQYVIDALTFTETESKIIDEMSAYISGEFKITDIKPAAFGEVVFSDADSDDKWYKAKLQYITLDDKSGKEKKATTTYLVQAASLKGAVNQIEEMMKNSLSDYIIANVTETMIMDVFEHKVKSKTSKKNDKPEYEE